MKTDHGWNVLNIMRFYNNIKKPYTAETYREFMNCSVEEAVPRSIIRRYVKNRWCMRKGEGYVITERGLSALAKYNEARREEVSEAFRENGRRSQEVNKQQAERKRNKYGTFTK